MKDSSTTLHAEADQYAARAAELTRKASALIVQASVLANLAQQTRNLANAAEATEAEERKLIAS